MRLLSIVSAAAVAVAALTVTSDAQAQRNRGQAATAVVVNYQRVLAESALGRDLQTKLGQIGSQLTSEAQALRPEGQSIEEERQRLATSLRNQNAQQLQSNPQVQALAQRQQQLQVRAATLQGDLECSQLIALRDVRNQIMPVIRTVMQQRGAGIVVDSTNALETSPDFDITATVIQQLDANQATRTANVTRHGVAECQAQQPAAAQ